eukprot:c55030_g1_i1 orf=81-260(-)
MVQLYFKGTCTAMLIPAFSSFVFDFFHVHEWNDEERVLLFLCNTYIEWAGKNFVPHCRG